MIHASKKYGQAEACPCLIADYRLSLAESVARAGSDKSSSVQGWRDFVAYPWLLSFTPSAWRSHCPVLTNSAPLLTRGLLFFSVPARGTRC